MKIHKITFIKTALTLIIFCCTISLTNATSTKFQSDQKVLEYFKANIIPVMKPYRYEFNEKLSTDEKAKIENIRLELTEIRQNLQKEGLTLKEKKLRVSKLSDAQVNLIKTSKDKLYQALFETMTIANNHKEDIQKIFQNENVNRKKWRNDIAEIRDENSMMRIMVINPILKQNLTQLEPLDHFFELAFILWNPDKPISNTL